MWKGDKEEDWCLLADICNKGDFCKRAHTHIRRTSDLHTRCLPVYGFCLYLHLFLSDIAIEISSQPDPLWKEEVDSGLIKASLSPSRAGRGPSWGSQASRHTPAFGVERQSATSLSVPPHCLLSWGLTRSCNCSSTISHTQTHPRHTCTLGIRLYAESPTHAPGAHVSLSSGSRLLRQFVLVPFLHPPPPPFCFGSLWSSFVSSRLSNVYLFTTV